MLLKGVPLKGTLVGFSERAYSWEDTVVLIFNTLMSNQFKVNNNGTSQMLNGNILVLLLPVLETYSEPCQTSKIKRFAKIVFH